MTSPTFNLPPPVCDISPNATFRQQHHHYLALLQLSDLHLLTDENQYYNGINPAQNLQAVLTKIQTEFANSDAIVLTGDLLQQPQPDNYDRLFAKFGSLNKPFVAVAGNHDVTLELDWHLPFFERRHEPITADPRLVNRHLISSPFWNIICLDSTVRGKVYGKFCKQTLAWLDQTLTTSEKPCVIFAHHPMVLIHSAWIDHHTLKNSAAFWEVVAPHQAKLKAIFVGHVHQELHVIHQGISLYTCPAVSAQFKSFCDDYTLDDMPAGFRWITLYNNGTLATGIKRIDTI